MITTNRRQLARVCQALLDTCALSAFWTDDGPTDLAVRAQNGVDDISDAQRVMVAFAWLLWSGTEELRFADFLGQVADESLVAVGTLFVASTYGQQGIADWLSMQNAEAGSSRAGDDADSDSEEEPPLTH